MADVRDIRPTPPVWPKRRIEKLDPGGRPRNRHPEEPERRDEDGDAVEGPRDESPETGGHDDGTSGGNGIDEYV